PTSSAAAIRSSRADDTRPVGRPPSGIPGQGMGRVSTSVLRITGSPAGRLALNTDRNTSPDTVFDPSDPVSVTLISRPDTPRRERSSRIDVPAAVRRSALKIASRADREEAGVPQVANGAAASYAVPSGARSGEPRRYETGVETIW